MIKKFIHLIFRLVLSYNDYAKYRKVVFGQNCRIYTKNFGSEPFLISIGNNVTVTSGVKFVTHDGTTWLMRDEKGRRYFYQRISIGDNVFIGVNSIILPGVKIENNVIVAAGSVVTKSIPNDVIVAGVPAKIIGKFNEIETRMLSNYISDIDMDSRLSYEDRILKVVTNGYKNYLKN
jgi:acetyltransferase-like isoleucine patch superfamily enzyme